MTTTHHDAPRTPQATTSPEPRENFIAGRWTPPSSGQHMTVINPRNGAQITTVPESGPADIDVAVQAPCRHDRRTVLRDRPPSVPIGSQFGSEAKTDAERARAARS